MYILEQRLTAYAKKISRLYRNPALLSAVRRVVYEPLEGIINARGAHVHRRRFTDERLGDDLEFEYQIAQREWKKRIKANNQTTRKIIDQYFKLLQVVMCENGKI